MVNRLASFIFNSVSSLAGATQQTAVSIEEKLLVDYKSLIGKKETTALVNGTGFTISHFF